MMNLNVRRLLGMAVIGFIAFSINPEVNARDVYVSTNGNPSAQYDSWGSAFTNLHDALDWAQPGDTLYLAGHTFASESAISITKPNLTLLGGYVATNTAGVPGDYDSDHWPTILTADGSIHRILHINGVTNVTLERLTVTGGEANLGGGIFVNTATNILLADLVVYDNLSITNAAHQVARGGGLYALNSDLVVSNSRFIANRSLRGQTYANVSGAGVDLNGGTVTLVDSWISGNVLDSNVTAGRSFGSGIRISSGTHVLRNLVISHNAMNGNNGNAIYSRSANVEVHNATIVGHAGTAINADASLRIYNSILRGNGTDVSDVPNGNIYNTCLQTPDLTGSQGNFNADPRFERGLYLSADSPCIGAGDRTVAAANLTGYTTHTNGVTYTGDVNLGYHHKAGLALPELYVNPTSGDDGNTGFDPTTEALQTITEALSRARTGTRINLAAGDYANTFETFPLAITLHGIQIEGTNRVATVIDAAGSDQRVMTIRQSIGSRLQGLTITGGRQNSLTAAGAGLHIQDGADLKFINSLFHDNRITSLSAHYQVKSGGAIYAANVSATMQDCCVTNNSVFAGISSYGQGRTEGNARGGGLFIAGGAWSIERSVIADNWAESHFSNNSGSRGGGIYFDTVGSHVLRNVLVARNACLRGGGSSGEYLGDGIYTRAPLTLEHVTIADNGTGNPVEGQGIWMSAAVAMANSIVWGQDNDLFENSPGLASITYSCIEDGDKQGQDGNVSLDPMFLDHQYYHLKSTQGVYSNGYFSDGQWVTADGDSPLIDAGDPALAAHSEPQPNGARVNMGAYGNTAWASMSRPLSAVNRAATLVTPNSATLNAEIMDVGTSNVFVWFHWGLDDGVWTANAPAGVLSSPGTVALPIDSLFPEQTYYYTLFASNAMGDTVWATPSTNFFTGISAPEIQTVGVDDEKTATPTLRGELISTGGANPDVYVCWGPTEGGADTSTWQHVEWVGVLSDGPFAKQIAADAGSNYYFTVFATNAAGGAFGIPKPFGYYHIRYVNSAAGGSGTGYNWQNGFTSLAAALQATSSTETNLIYVKGTFPLTAELLVTNRHVQIVGGYAGDGYPGSRDPALWPSMLTNNAAPIRLLSVRNTEDVLLDGLNVAGGTLVSGHGGGLLIDGSTNITVRDSVIRGNQTLAGHGGGIGVVASTNVAFESVTLNGNTAENGTTYGGGLYLLNSWGVITNGWIAGNTPGEATADLGGGAMISGGGWSLRDSVWLNNRAGHGGAVYVHSGTHAMENHLILQNRAVQGDGIFNQGALTAYNLTLAGNLGEGIRHAAGTTTVRDSILWANRTETVGAADVDDSLVAVDPLFEYGVYLAGGSPARDAGGRTAEAAGLTSRTTRADGTPDSGTVDMGYHYAAGKDPSTADLHVTPGGAGSQSGLDWDNALPSITAALELAGMGSHIHLADGDYTNAQESFPLVIRKHGIRMIGSGRETTVLDATGADQRLIDIDNIFGSRIENLSLTGGRHITDHAVGGALRILDSSDLRVLNCRIHDNELPAFGSNYHTKRGGGFYAVNTIATLADSLVVNNLAHSGGTSYGHNVAEGTSRGGGIFLSGGQWTLTRSVIAGNEARVSFGANSGSRGGGIYADTGGNHALRNVLIAGNECTRSVGPGSYPGEYHGDGIYTRSPIAIVNATIVDNGDGNPDASQGIWASVLTAVTNVIVWGHDEDGVGTVEPAYSIVGNLGDLSAGPGCLSADPLFVDPSTGDYQLQQNLSPAIDAGVNQPWMADATDLLGMPRIMKGLTGGTAAIVDMGAYEAVPPRGSMFMMR